MDDSYHILAVSRNGQISSRDGDPWTLKCSDCHMVFGDVGLLRTHKARFCVGSTLGDPEALSMSKPRPDQPQPKPERLNLPDDDETPRYDSARDPKVLQLAENHGKQMEYYKHQNEELEKQREEIRRQLEELGRRQPPKDSTAEDLLRELREEEERSKKLLEELRRQLLEARRPINVIQAPEKPDPESKSFAYPMVYGSTFVQEILAVKEAYIRNGGNDPEILRQLDEQLAEARALEESMNNMPQKQAKPREDDSQLISVEMENKRLLEQLIQLQEQKALNKPRTSDKDGDIELELKRLRREHQRKTYEMEVQIERLRQEAQLDRLLLEIQLRGGGQPPPAPGPKIVLKQRPPPPAQPATAPQIVQTEAYDVTLPYEEDGGDGRYHMYGHTWVHTQHRQAVEEDPEYDLDL